MLPMLKNSAFVKVVLAPDSFKECLSSAAVAQAIAKGVKLACPHAQIDAVPMADGGEGTVDAMVCATGGTYCREMVHGPLGEPVEATFGLLGQGETAVMEMAQASGLELIEPGKRNPLLTSTRGTGELIRAALGAGVKRIILGIGGSATVDGGTGMARALGARFFDSQGFELPEGGGALAKLHSIDLSKLDSRIADVQIEVACDVTNPLVGPEGAARIFGPQKGATAEMVEHLEQGLANLGRQVALQLGKDVIELPGAGAAGGLGAGLVAFLNAKLRRGIELIIDVVGLAERLKDADLCITGEGKLDSQSASGKTVAGIGHLAKSLNVPVIVLAGSVGPGAELLLKQGISEYISIKPDSMSIREAIERAPELLAQAAEKITRKFFHK